MCVYIYNNGWLIIHKHYAIVCNRMGVENENQSEEEDHRDQMVSYYNHGKTMNYQQFSLNLHF